MKFTFLGGRVHLFVPADHMLLLCAISVICALTDPFSQGNSLSGVALVLWWAAINSVAYLCGELVAQNVFRPLYAQKHIVSAFVAGSLIAAANVTFGVSLVIFLMTKAANGQFELLPTIQSIFPVAILIGLTRLYFLRSGVQGVPGPGDPSNTSKSEVTACFPRLANAAASLPLAFKDKRLSIEFSPWIQLLWPVVPALCVVANPFREVHGLESGMAIYLWWLMVHSTAATTGESIVQNYFRVIEPTTNTFLDLATVSGLCAAVVATSITLAIFVTDLLLGNSNPPWKVWLITFPTPLAIGAFRSYYIRNDILSPEPTGSSEENQLNAPPPLADRLPAYLGDKIYYFRSSDHYVEITTSKGKHLALMRFRDALDEVKGLDGFQVHRGCWIALSAVVSTTTRQKKMMIETVDGELHSVSRSFRSEIRDRLRLTGSRPRENLSASES